MKGDICLPDIHGEGAVGAGLGMEMDYLQGTAGPLKGWSSKGTGVLSRERSSSGTDSDGQLGDWS